MKTIESMDVEAVLSEIARTHHDFLRRHVERVGEIVADMTTFGDAGDEVRLEIRQLSEGLRLCVESRLAAEEEVLFPMLRWLTRQTHVSKCQAGMIRSRVMMAERDLARIRGVVVKLGERAEEILSPAGPCELCHELLRVTAALLEDLREHARKESDVVFPWAIAREDALAH